MAQQHRIIKKYPNRRLYDTKTSSYITLADIKQMVLKQEEFQVVDAKTSDDLTRHILLQVILEEESGGAPMFSSDVLSQLIRSYGNAMQGMMGTYLEKNIHAFQDMQKTMQEQSQKMPLGDVPNLRHGGHVPMPLRPRAHRVLHSMHRGMHVAAVGQERR